MTGKEYYKNEQEMAQKLIQKGITPKPYIKANQEQIDSGLADKDWIWYSDEELESFFSYSVSKDTDLHTKATTLLNQHLDNPHISTKDLIAIKEQSFKEIRTITKNEDQDNELIPSTIQIQIINN